MTTSHDSRALSQSGRRRLAGLVAGLLLAVAVGGVSEAQAQTKPAAKSTGKSVIAVFSLSETLSESPKAEEFLSFGPAGGETLRELVARMKKVCDDKQVKAVVLTGGSLPLAQTEEVRQVLDQIKAAGKEVHVHLDSLSTGQYALMSAASSISVVPTGEVWIMGFHAESPYVRGLLDLLGVQPDFFTCGTYKSAAEMFMRKGPSPEAAQMQDWLLDSQFSTYVDLVAKGRRVSPEMVRLWIDGAPYSAEKAKALGIIDKVEYLEDFTAGLKAKYGDNVQWDKRYGKSDKLKDLDLSSPLGLVKVWMEAIGSQAKKKSTKDAVAVVYVDGAIMTGEGEPGPLDFAESMAYSTPIRKALDEVAADSSVKAVVLRVDSPGGSAVASEIILAATKRVKAKKPFVVSMGRVAGSGGYYVACGADTIFADAATITASIGVVSGKFATTGLWDKAGVAWHSAKRGAMADILSSGRVFSADEKSKLQGYMDEVYGVFKKHVTDVRGSRLKKPIDELAGGRVFTGKQALDLGLVDKLGTLDDAIGSVAKQAGLKDYEVRVVPRPKSFLEGLFSDIGDRDEDSKDSSTAPSTAARLLAPRQPNALIGTGHAHAQGHGARPRASDQGGAGPHGLAPTRAGDPHDARSAVRGVIHSGSKSFTCSACPRAIKPSRPARRISLGPRPSSPSPFPTSLGPMMAGEADRARGVDRGGDRPADLERQHSRERLGAGLCGSTPGGKGRMTAAEAAVRVRALGAVSFGRHSFAFGVRLPVCRLRLQGLRLRLEALGLRHWTRRLRPWTFRLELRHQAVEFLTQHVVRDRINQPLQEVDPAADLAKTIRPMVGGPDLGVRRGQGFFVVEIQLLVELLARPHAGKLHLDGVFGQPGQPDQVPGQIDDPHGLAHFQDEDLAAAAHGGGLQHELRGLGNGHEVAFHAGVGDGDRAAAADLLLEDRNHAPGRAEHVSEPNHGVACGRLLRERVDVSLGDLLGDAHDAGGMDRLVRGDEHEVLGVELVGQIGDAAGAEDVVLDGLADVAFHQRDVLVGSGMEDDGGAKTVEDQPHPGGVADVADAAVDLGFARLVPELAIDGEDAVLTAADEDQGLGMEVQHLAAYLGSDAPPGAGDQNGAVRQETADGVGVQLDGLAPQEVVDFDVADGYARVAVEAVLEGGDDPQVQIGLLAGLHQGPQPRAGQQPGNHQDVAHAMRLGDLRTWSSEPRIGIWPRRLAVSPLVARRPLIRNCK